MKSQIDTLDSDLLVKSGEIALIRKNLSQKMQENNELRENFSKQVVVGEHAKEAIRDKLQKEIERLNTELTFKVFCSHCDILVHC